MPKNQIDARVVVNALGEWSTAEGPLFRRIAAGIAAAIQRGDLPSGSHLPAERVLSQLLNVARGTVVAAYEALRVEGWVDRRQGSGTWVCAEAIRPVVEVADYAAGVRARRLTERFFRPGADVIDLGLSVLPDTAGLPDWALPSTLDEVAALGADHGYQPYGVTKLRRRIAEIQTLRGLPTTEDEIIVTLGAQQAIALTARLLVRPGDRVLLEDPTYPGAIDAYSRAGAHLVSVPTDGAGARVDAMDREGARVAYVIPSCHNPTGSVMPEGRRRALAELAERRDLWVVEDHSLSHLLFEGSLPPPVGAFDRSGRVLTIGSLSKLLWGGLRIGWIRAPKPVIGRLGRLKSAQDLGNCAVSQAVALRALDAHDELVASLRARFAAGAEHLAGLLRKSLPEWTFDVPAGGLSLWVQLPEGSADEFAQVAATHGVSFLPGGSASVDGAFLGHMRISFAHDPAVLDEAVRRLVVAWADYRNMDPVARTMSSLG